MSVIIRLQNLPWSANAMDIRTFFKGLSIPEGGVHIVGGEQGDAFIAFSTDEDARQAMMNDGGKIKEIQVKLLLSSRSEMHKVIESARQSVSFLQLSQPIVAPVQQPTLPASITGLLGANIKSIPINLPSFPLPQIETITTPAEVMQSSDSDKDKRNYKSNDRRSIRSRSKSRDRDRKDRSRDRKDKRDRSRSRDRSRDRDRRRRDRSRSRDRRDRKRDRKDRSRERERTKEVTDPRLQRKEDKNDSSDDLNNKLLLQHFKSKEGLLGDFPHGGRMEQPIKQLPPVMQVGGPRPSFINQRMNPTWAGDMPLMNNQGQGNRMNNADGNTFPSRFNDNISMEQIQRLQELGEKRNPNAFQKSEPSQYNPRNMGPRNNYNDGNFVPNNMRAPISNFIDKNTNDSRNRYNIPVKGFCVKVTNLLTSTGYGDIRRFFSGNFISSQGLKIINNENGKRSGTVLVKFCKIEGKQNALSKNGELLKGRPVVITHLNDEEFDNAVDSYRPNKESDDSGDEGDSQKSLVIVEKNESEDKHDVYKVLLLEDLPAFAKEHDIIKMFSDYSLLSIHIVVTKDVRKQYLAYVEFLNADDAKAALNNKSKHLIGHKVIKVSPCSDAAFDAAKANQSNIDEVYSERSSIDMQNQEDYPDNDLANIPRDPRQRRFDSRQEDGGSFKQMRPFHGPPNQGNNLRFQWRGNSNPYSNHGPDRDHHPMMRRPLMPQNDFGKPPQIFNCVFMKGLPLRTNDRNVLDFFSDVGVIPSKTHLMLTTLGQPSGDCFCEFMDPDEALSALSKNGSTLDGNVITVELVTKQIVDEARGIISPEKNYNMRGGFRGRGFGISRGHPRRMRGGPAPYHTGIRGGGNRFMGPVDHMYNNDCSAIEGFGAPGCVLSLENVPFRATIEEILNFFRDFDLSPNDIFRRFNDKGTPTGDVRVSLQSPGAAQRAVQQLNKKYIRDRMISLSLL